MADESSTPREGSEQRFLDAAHHINRQVDALLWLSEMLQPERPLPPLGGWAASADLMREVVKWIFYARPRAIVEMGSGASTVVMAMALRRSGSGHLISLEHEPKFAKRTRVELAGHGLSDVATVIDTPLGEVMIEGVPRLWYTVPIDQLPSRIDVVFVDGPPSGVAPLARYPAMPFLSDRIADTAAVYLDDGVYADVQEIAARWQQAHPDFTLRQIPSEKDCLVLMRGT